MKLAVLGAAALAALACIGALALRWRRRIAITELGRQRGLGEESAAFLGRLFAGDGMDAAETMLAAPELLRARLARELRRRRRVESAQAYANRAAHLLEELNTIAPAFPGAPSPFMQIALQDSADPNGEVVTAWVLSVDERNIAIVSRDDCDWPMRRELVATPAAGHGEPFRASLLLRPVPPRHEWVLTHDLVDVITNRRASVRVSCCLHTHVLPDSGDTVLLRERLADQETVAADELRRLHGWAQRHGGTVLDVSSDGCRVELDHDIAVRDRFHVVFVAPDDRLAGMPLAEVVSLQRASGGRVTAGVRFIGMRLKERTRLAEFVRELAASQGGKLLSETKEDPRAVAAAGVEAAVAATAEGAADGNDDVNDAGNAEMAADPWSAEAEAGGEAVVANADAAPSAATDDPESADGAEACVVETEDEIEMDAANQGERADMNSRDAKDNENEPREIDAWKTVAPRDESAGDSWETNDGEGKDDGAMNADEDAPPREVRAIAKAESDDGDDSDDSADSDDENDDDDEATKPNDEDRRRAMERLGLIPPSRPSAETRPAQKPAAMERPAQDPTAPGSNDSAASDDPWEYTPRFTSPFALPKGRESTPPPIEPEARPGAYEPLADYDTSTGDSGEAASDDSP